VGFLTWVMEQRMRPEVRFRFFDPNDEPWTENEVPDFTIGRDYLPTVALDNIGNGTAANPVLNIIVP